MSKPGLGIRRIIKKYATSHTIIRYTRGSATYVGGILQDIPSTTGAIKIHIQPIGKGDLIADLPEGQKQENVKKGYTLESIGKKDEVIIGNAIFTVNAIQEWPESNHTECDLIRTGEADNVYA